MYLVHGQGTYTYKLGDYYEGNFRMGAFDGFGIFYYKSGDENGDVYEGYWQSGREHGPGVYTFANGVMTPLANVYTPGPCSLPLCQYPS